MIRENNTPTQLKRLWKSDIIDTKQYFFRLKAYELDTPTYKMY